MLLDTVEPLTERQKVWEKWQVLEDELKRQVHRFCNSGRSVVQNPLTLSQEQYDKWLNVQRALFIDLFDESNRQEAINLMEHTKVVVSKSIK